jgi:hypothetical protein
VACRCVVSAPGPMRAPARAHVARFVNKLLFTGIQYG